MIHSYKKHNRRPCPTTTISMEKIQKSTSYPFVNNSSKQRTFTLLQTFTLSEFNYK